MTIKQVSEKYGISTDTLRYYEKCGLIPAVNRKANGIRDYTDYDCGWVEFVMCMRNAGLAVEVISEYVSLFLQGDSTTEQRKALLISEREKLAHKLELMRATLDRLDRNELKVQCSEVFRGRCGSGWSAQTFLPVS